VESPPPKYGSSGHPFGTKIFTLREWPTIWALGLWLNNEIAGNLGCPLFHRFPPPAQRRRHTIRPLAITGPWSTTRKGGGGYIHPLSQKIRLIPCRFFSPLRPTLWGLQEISYRDPLLRAHRLGQFSCMVMEWQARLLQS